VIGEMVLAWLTLQQHTLDISTLNQSHSTQRVLNLYTHRHSTGETNTHFIVVVDVGFGFEQCDDRIGVTTTSSPLQGRAITLRTHNDTERQSKCAGIPHLTRTIFSWSMLALALSSAMTVSVCPHSAATIKGVLISYKHTMILRDSQSAWASLI